MEQTAVKKKKTRKKNLPPPPLAKTFDTKIEYPNFNFEITYKDPKSGARLGKLTTPHGTIETPNYIFCGTKASIKNLSPYQMREAKTDIILANTYHLMIQPGADIIEKMGGLHKFTGWNGPMLTDSGGVQVFSMGNGSCAELCRRGGHGEIACQTSRLRTAERERVGQCVVGKVGLCDGDVFRAACRADRGTHDA